MPLHFYAPAAPPCKLCGPGFEHHAAAGSAPLANCPVCGQSVARAPAENVALPKLSASATVSRARAAGFAVLRRTADGGFESQ